MRACCNRVVAVGWLLGCLTGLLSTSQARARAGPGPASPRAPARRVAPARHVARTFAVTVVMLAARDQARASKELHQAVAGQLSDASVSLELRWVARFAARPPAQLAQARRLAKGREVVVVFWCDLSARGEIFLYLVEPSQGRLIVRSVASAGGGGRSESVAIIVATSVRAILSNLPRARLLPRPRLRPRVGVAAGSRPLADARARGPTTASARRPSMPLTPDNPLFVEGARLNVPQAPEGSRWLALEMGYALDFYGRRQMASHSTYPPQHGASIGLAVRFAKHWSAFVSFRVIEPIKAKGDTVQTSLQRYPLSVGGQFRAQLGRWVELAGSLSFTFDHVTVDAKVPATWPPPANEKDLLYLIGGEVRLSILVVERLRIHFALGAEVCLNPIWRSWDPGDQDQPIILDPWPIQPYLRVGISLDII
jgi:hypothetical protein